ncbi:Visual system homeobox 1 [Toxocara canis]|nr:Visual system homeobox 1 [Toxocara canis]
MPLFAHSPSDTVISVTYCGHLEANSVNTADKANRRRFRTNFTENQSIALEEAFQESHYPDQNSKRNLSMILDVPEDRITVWFQNRRAKWRRKELREREKKRFPPKEYRHVEPSLVYSSQRRTTDGTMQLLQPPTTNRQYPSATRRDQHLYSTFPPCEQRIYHFDRLP